MLMVTYRQHNQKNLCCFFLSTIAFDCCIWYYIVISKGVPSTVVSPLSTVYLLPTSLDATVSASEKHRWLVPPAVFFHVPAFGLLGFSLPIPYDALRFSTAAAFSML